MSVCLPACLSVRRSVNLSVCLSACACACRHAVIANHVTVRHAAQRLLSATSQFWVCCSCIAGEMGGGLMCEKCNQVYMNQVHFTSNHARDSAGGFRLVKLMALHLLFCCCCCCCQGLILEDDHDTCQDPAACVLLHKRPAVSPAWGVPYQE